jgi:hypothetical protein
MTGATYTPQQVVQRAGLIAWTIALGAVTAEALSEREQLPLAVATERLDAAAALGLLTRWSVLVGHPVLYTGTSAGRKLARKYAHGSTYPYPKGLRLGRVSIKGARHAIACAGVRAALERRYSDHRLIGVSELARDEREGGRRLATVEVHGAGSRRVHFPDMVIWPPCISREVAVPLPVAVEVELTEKAKEELTDNCRAWARSRDVEAVLYYAETRGIEEKLLDVIDECKAQEMIVVNPLSAILKPQPGFPLNDG